AMVVSVSSVPCPAGWPKTERPTASGPSIAPRWNSYGAPRQSPWSTPSSMAVTRSWSEVEVSAMVELMVVFPSCASRQSRAGFVVLGAAGHEVIDRGAAGDDGAGADAAAGKCAGLGELEGGLAGDGQGLGCFR